MQTSFVIVPAQCRIYARITRDFKNKRAIIMRLEIVEIVSGSMIEL